MAHRRSARPAGGGDLRVGGYHVVVSEHISIGRGTTAIEWATDTWNPTTGCTRVSPGCAHCYIERTPPFRTTRRRFERVGDEETTGVRLHPERLDQPLRWRRPRLVFVNSLSDLFHNEISDAFRREIFNVMAEARQHSFQVLTKRPLEAASFLDLYYDRQQRSADRALPNVWIGVSIENARYTWRADVLRKMPAAVRFISAEPLLGSVFERRGVRHRPLDLAGIDWVIAGGESGPNYRPVKIEWVREARDACISASVPFFFKQWGGRVAKSGGRELDGRTWDELPLACAA